MSNKNTRKKAILRRRIFIIFCVAVLIIIIGLVVFAIKALLTRKSPEKPTVSNASSQVQNSSTDSSASKTDSSSSASDSASYGSAYSTVNYPATGPDGLDANYSNLLLVNADNPLPQNFDYEGHLTTIPDNYINGSLKQIDAKVWPYMKAMIDAAWKDNVKLYVWSPYRSYDTQDMLFKKQVQRCLNKGTPADKAEDEAATIVAKPGTSEHNTGLAADFNMASDQFESTQMYKWMQAHAADYGFVMRYSGDKQNLTGVIHESWHYRFVGINTAKEMNRLGMCLEEYVASKK